jgi:hypothetical protein
MTFDYTTAADRAGISRENLERLKAFLRAEFPDDEMMADLHILRAVLAVERGDVTLEQILRQEVAG